MVSIRRHSRWKGPLGPAEDPPLHLHPVEVEALGADEPACFLRDIDLNQPPPIPRGRGRGRPRGSRRGRGRGRGRSRGRGGGGQLLLRGNYQKGRGRRGRQVPGGLLFRSDLSPDAKSIVLGLAAPEPGDGDKIAALAACNDCNNIRKKAICYLKKRGSQENCVYLREGGSHEIVPVATPIGIADAICEEVPLLELGGCSTPNEIGEQAQKDQPDCIVEQTDMLWERDGKTVKAKGRGSNNLNEHTARRGKRKSTSDLIEESNPKKALAVKFDSTWAREAAAHREVLEKTSSRIKSQVESFKKSLGDVFVVPSFDPPPDKYHGAPGVILRATDITDSSERDFFTYVQQDMKTLQGLANAETVDTIALSSQINKILTHWTKLFSSHISGGMAEMIQALNELKGLVASDAVSLLPFDAAGVTAHKIRVEEALKEAAALQEAIPGALKEICEVEAAAHVKYNDLAALKEKHKKKIARLRASLALAEKSLKEIENQEIEIEQLLEESEAARHESKKYSDDLKETTDSGELAISEVQKCMWYIGGGSKPTQPKPVRSLISFMQSSSCEG